LPRSGLRDSAQGFNPDHYTYCYTYWPGVKWLLRGATTPNVFQSVAAPQPRHRLEAYACHKEGSCRGLDQIETHGARDPHFPTGPATHLMSRPGSNSPDARFRRQAGSRSQEYGHALRVAAQSFRRHCCSCSLTTISCSRPRIGLVSASCKPTSSAERQAPWSSVPNRVVAMLRLFEPS
jgi:hypothetical protein